MIGNLISWLTQVLTVTWFNLSNIRARLGWSASTIIGIAGVVMVCVGILSIASGFRSTLASTGDAESIIVMRSGSGTEMMSGLGMDSTKIIGDAPGVGRGEAGALASSELFVIVDVPKKSSGTDANVPLRGVSPAAYEVRGDFEILEGRTFEPGRKEIIVGEAAAGEFAGLDVGAQLRWGENDWTVVGIFSTGGTAEDTEIWCDAKVLQPAYRRGNSFQSVHVRLASGDQFDTFKDALTTDPRLNVKVISKADYWADQASATAGFIQVFGMVIGGLMGFGAIFGALNTMYTAVSTRTKEIATLRALGFGSGPVVISVLVEAVLLALVGGIVGCALAYLFFNDFRAATLNFQTFSQIAFAFAVTPPLLIGGIVYSLVMGFVGGFFPAIRAAYLPVATALRQH
ncbi:MAG: ABC transporter permease [Acidobacteriota bacterium]